MRCCAVPVCANSLISKVHILKGVVLWAKSQTKWPPGGGQPVPVCFLRLLHGCGSLTEWNCGPCQKTLAFRLCCPATPSSLAPRQIISFHPAHLRRRISGELPTNALQTPGASLFHVPRAQGKRGASCGWIDLENRFVRIPLGGALSTVSEEGAGSWWIHRMKHSATRLKFKVICCLFNGNWSSAMSYKPRSACLIVSAVWFYG